MSDGPSQLEQTIATFEALLAEMKDVTREAHSTLKQLRHERREIDRMLAGDVKDMIDRRVDEVVKTELDRIGPEIHAQTSRIYARVSTEVQKLIDLSLGKEFVKANGREDLRPQLAAKMRQWIQEVIDGC